MSQLTNGTTLHGSVDISKAGSAVVTFDTDGKFLEKDIVLTINVGAGSAATPATTMMTNPTITVSDTGLVTASYSVSSSIAPMVSSGYVTSGTAGTVSASGSSTYQLDIATVNETKTYLGIPVS